MNVYSAEQLSELAMRLGAIEDWLLEKCEARHAADMAGIVGQAVQVLEDVYDEQQEREEAARVRELAP